MNENTSFVEWFTKFMYDYPKFRIIFRTFNSKEQGVKGLAIIARKNPAERADAPYGIEARHYLSEPYSSKIVWDNELKEIIEMLVETVESRDVEGASYDWRQ